MVELNHTIVWCKDQKRSSAFLAEMLGLPAPARFGHFDVITLANGISMDFANSAGPITPQHYAFLITEAEFDAVLERIKAQGLDYWAEPARRRPRERVRADSVRALEEASRTATATAGRRSQPRRRARRVWSRPLRLTRRTRAPSL
jgi:catechol 2,3-dioxygenase-like lactoylglutathione lyase family enzyme